MCCRSYFNSVWACLPCHLSNGPVKRDFLDIYLTSSSEVRNFKYTSAMRVIFFPKIFKIEYKFRKFKHQKKKKKKRKEKKNEKLFFVSEILSSENVTINCLY